MRLERGTGQVKKSFEIRGKTIGAGAPCYIVAEAGSNHNGKLELALDLIDVAAEASADAVKFQTFEAKRLYPKSAGVSDYLGDPTPIYDIIEAMEMPASWLPKLADRAHSSGLAFISSPFHEEAVALLDPYVDAFKIASYEMTHTPLLREVAKTKKPVIMSTGASRDEEVGKALATLEEAGCQEVVVLQCTAAYPAPLESLNVRALQAMATTHDVLTGLSDHSRSPTIAPMTAAAIGAAVIEKHFTMSRKLPGPDHAFAIEPDELKLLVQNVRAVELALGSGKKVVHDVERELRTFARRSLFTTRSIAAGELFSKENIDVLRQGKLGVGLPPEALDRVLGSRATRDLPPETVLSEEDVTREPR